MEEKFFHNWFFEDSLKAIINKIDLKVSDYIPARLMNGMAGVLVINIPRPSITRGLESLKELLTPEALIDIDISGREVSLQGTTITVPAMVITKKIQNPQ